MKCFADGIVRALTSGDGEQIKSLRLEALKTAPMAFGSTYENERERPVERFATMPALADGLRVGAFVRDQLIGTANLMCFGSPVTRHWSHLTGMYVAEAYRGTGAADAIVEMLLEYGEGRFFAAELSVTGGNDRAYRFYSRHGFKEYARRPSGMRYGGRNYDEILMWRRFGPENRSV